jgi:molybdate transport system substrate-binding protein
MVAAGSIALSITQPTLATEAKASSKPAEMRGKATILAASSLTDAFTLAAKTFSKEHPKARIEFSFVPSPAAVSQVQEGAPVDAIVTADLDSLQPLINGKNLAEAPRIVATNSLAIAVQPKNPTKITSLKDLSRKNLVVVLCASKVPCGRLSDEALKKSKVTVNPRSREPNVRAALSRVVSGEADAAIVYRSDIVSAGSTVAAVSIPASQNVTTKIPAAVVANAKNSAVASAFLDFLTTAAGRNALTSSGFELPAA